jgi:hypothetical protein
LIPSILDGGEVIADALVSGTGIGDGDADGDWVVQPPVITAMMPNANIDLIILILVLFIAVLPLCCKVGRYRLYPGVS